MISKRTCTFGVLFALNFCLPSSVSAKTFVFNSFKSNKSVTTADLPPPCDSQIYCYGRLLDTVQMAQIFADSKTFVDMKMNNTPEVTLKNFEDMMATHNNTPEKSDIEEFVFGNFHEPGKEFEDWLPTDWKEKPRYLDLVRDPDLKQWGNDLNALWKILGRKMIDDVQENPQYYSIIHVPHPVIIPGGRFREFYYWDSYWIIRGLLLCEMSNTARGMLQNFMSIVSRYGFIPNGGRIYYSQRSQPPLLAGMIDSYVEFTKDEKFAIDSVEILEHEYEYWINNHSVEVNGYNLVTYGDRSSGPRPESYREDLLTSAILETEDERQEHFAELKAAAESGMDFSSRWFIDENGTNNGSLVNLKTRKIIPVELNAILYWNAKIIAKFHSMAGNVSKSQEYESKAQKIQEAIQAVLWNEEVGAWLDYDLLNNKPRNYFVPTNLAPLWTKCYNIADEEKISESVLKYINDTGIDNYPGGVPNTLLHTGEQWDFPNVWPPMQYMLIMGLDNLKTAESKALAKKWAERWVQSNFKAYAETQSMFEKYNAETFGGHGGGGEYEVQKGFGWSNGVILELLVKYGDSLHPASTGSNLLSGFGLKGLLAICTLIFRRHF